MKKIILLVLVVLCNSVIFAQKSHKTNYTHFKQYKEDAKQSIYVADYDASRRGSIIIHDHNDTKNPIRILSEPPPDAIIAFSTTISNNINIDNKFNAVQSLEFTQAISELTKRNTTIVILRDALYRLNEYDFNNPGKVDDKLYLEKFDKILSLAEKINAKEEKEIQNDSISKKNENLKLMQQVGFTTKVPIYFQITNKNLKQYSNKLVSSLNELGYTAEGSELREVNLKENQLRYFHPDDKEKAEDLAKDLISLGLKGINVIDSSGFKKLRNQFEIWITTN